MLEEISLYDAGREYGRILERFTTALVDLEEARCSQDALREELFAKEEIIKKLKGELEAKEGQIASFQFRLDRLQDENTRIRDDFQEDVETLQCEVERLNGELRERDTRINIDHYQIDELKGKIATLRAEKQNLIDDNSSLASRVEQLHSEIDQLHSEIEHLRSLRRAKVIVPSKQDPLSSLCSVYAERA